MNNDLTKRDREFLMVADRIAGATFREIARRYGLSKSQVHRLLRDVPILRGSRAPSAAVPRITFKLVPHPDGGHVAVPAHPAASPLKHCTRKE